MAFVRWDFRLLYRPRIVVRKTISLVISQRFRGFESTALRQSVLDVRDILRAFANCAAVLRTISGQRGPEIAR